MSSVSKNDAAQDLARKHFEVEVGLRNIFRLMASAEQERSSSEPIKLLEVNTNTAPAGILPLYFGPAPACGLPFPSVIVEVTPEEFARIQANELKLPNGWSIGDELPRPAEPAGAA